MSAAAKTKWLGLHAQWGKRFWQTVPKAEKLRVVPQHLHLISWCEARTEQLHHSDILLPVVGPGFQASGHMTTSATEQQVSPSVTGYARRSERHHRQTKTWQMTYSFRVARAKEKWVMYRKARGRWIHSVEREQWRRKGKNRPGHSRVPFEDMGGSLQP